MVGADNPAMSQGAKWVRGLAEVRVDVWGTVERPPPGNAGEDGAMD